MLRGVDTERSECAQHDSAVTHPELVGADLSCPSPIYRAHRRFIVPIADLSASVNIPISGLFSKCASS